MTTFGFIGMGNMAQALAAGMIRGGKVGAEDLFAYAPNQEKLKKNAQAIGFVPCASPAELVAAAETIIIACKPHQIEGVLGEIKEALQGKALISIAAGWQLADFEKILGDKTRVQCVMPNTPVQVQEGVFMLETENTLETGERERLVDILSDLGLVCDVPAALQPAGMAIAGCGPAYIDLVMEALGDAGVELGLPRTLSYQLAAQMILGSAKLQRETGEHPGVLKDRVCSPGGTTIKGVDALEHAGIRAAFMDAVRAAAGK